MKRLSILVVLLATTLLVACASATATPTPGPTATPTPTRAPAVTPTSGTTPTALVTPTATKAPTPTSGATTQPGMADKQELRANLAGEPDVIDPNRASFSTELSPLKLMFEGLMGVNDKLEPAPVMATQVPTVQNGGISADGLTYTFKLKPGLKWSDGQPIKASDFEYSIKRMLQPETASEYASFYLTIKGATELNSASASTDALVNAVGVKATDESTVQITLANPQPTFLSIMTLWPTYPVRKDIIDKFGDKWTEPGNVVSSGPFVLKEWVHQDHMTFEANPNYWGDKPKLQRVVLRMITDPNAALAAYKNNELDLTSVPPGTEKATLADPVLSKEVLRFPELLTYAVQFNNTKAPFDNPAVRKALSKGIDRDAFINQVRGGVGRPTTSWLPPGMPGFDSNLGSEFKFDPAKAKTELAAAGYADVSKLPPMQFDYSDTAGNKLIAQFIQAQFKQNMGIDIVLNPVESKAFQQLIKNNGHHMAFLGWGADYPDPENFLAELFGAGAGNNHSLYSNPQFDALAAQAKKELDNTKRIQLWQQAEKLVVADAPVVFLYNRERFWVKKPNLTSLTTTGMDGYIPGDWFWKTPYISK